MADKMSVEQAVDILTDDKIFLVGRGYKLKAMEISVANNMASLLTRQQQMLQRACEVLEDVDMCPQNRTVVDACNKSSAESMDCAACWLEWLEAEQKQVEV